MTRLQETAQRADPWVLGTYRRLDVLDVPAFYVRDTTSLVPGRTSRPARLHRLPTALPREIMSLADWLGSGRSATSGELSDLTRLSLLFRYLSSPLRYEPDNIYQVHRAVPSARCAFPIDLLLRHTDRHGVRCTYQYHPDFHALEPLGGRGSGDDFGAAGDTTIFGIGRIWKMIRKYGDFSAFPVMLESGMMLAQLRHLRAALEWKGESGNNDAARSFCGGNLEIPVFAETIGQPAVDIATLPTRDVVLAAHADSLAGVPNFERLPLFIDLFDRRQGRVPDTLDSVSTPLEHDLEILDRGFLQTLRLRNSANDRVGMAPRMAGEIGLLRRFVTLVCRITSRRARIPGEERLRIVILWPGRVAPDCGIYDSEGRLVAGLDRVHVATILARALPSPALRYNMQAHSLLVFFLVDPHAENMQDAPAFRDAHVAAGALAQDWCIAGAALDQFARPLRMLHEHVLESALPIKGQIIYSLLCGSSRATNVCAELL